MTNSKIPPDQNDLEVFRENYSPTIKLSDLKRNYDYDMDKFVKYSSTTKISPDPVALAAFLTHAYHALEKGLAMEIPREGFGVAKILPTIAAILELERLGHSDFATQGARGMLSSYVDFHHTHELEIPAEIRNELLSFVNKMHERKYPGGAYTLTFKELKEATNFNYERFIQARSSVRHFTGEPVSPHVVRTAVSQSIKAPRTCNRETRRVYAAYEPEMRDLLLSYQSGNRGFGSKLGAVLLVTVDLRQFDIVGERNQGWVDGGLFAMSLVYALHAAGLGTCMLNWSEDCDKDQHLRGAFNIPDNEIIITLIGVGHIPEQVNVTASPAPDVDKVLLNVTCKEI